MQCVVVYMVECIGCSIDRYLSLPLDEGVDESNLDKKTLKQIRIGELLRETSSDARLIVV